MTPIPDILDELRAGRVIVLVDDEDRENEGDLVCAAELITPEIVNFMVKEGRGVLCVPLSGDICDQLEFHPQNRSNTSLHSTAFTVTIDAHERFGITTGVSAADRAMTIRLTAKDDTRAGDFVRPGHINPLRAHAGGVLFRAGQTEGSVDLCRLAGLKPAAAIIEVMNEDGSMARLDDLKTLCKKHSIKMCSVADIIQHRMGRENLIERIDEVPFDTKYGQFNLIAYRSKVDSLPHIALTCGDVGRHDASGRPTPIHEPVLVRMHSQNLLGDVFGDTGQPTGKTLHDAMRIIQREGRGAVVYLRHEGMGKGLLKRLQTLHFPDDHEGKPTERHFVAGAAGANPRRAEHGAYGIGSQILRDLGISRLRLLTNHPFHPTALSGFGLEIDEFVAVV